MNRNSKKYKSLTGGGVTLLSLANLEIDESVKIGRGTVLGGDVRILGKTTIGESCTIESGTYIFNSVIGNAVKILSSRITDSRLGNRVTVGPNAHIRMNSDIGPDVRVGNFVEIKNSEIGKNSKLAHLAYVGDATVGENVNVGCGVIFCNYDGKNKYHTLIGNDVFIGSNSNLVAPLKIGSGAFIAAGTTVTRDIDSDQFCTSRVQQRTHEKRVLHEIKKKYFGTDGIRGIYGKELTVPLATQCGNALARLKPGAKILIGRDTRASGEVLLNAFAVGAICAGADIIDYGVVTTPCISFLIGRERADFGVVISASHNPHEYNGIKIFDESGEKFSDEAELEIEKNLGRYYYGEGGSISRAEGTEAYEAYLLSVCRPRLANMKIALDCANGASFIVAPKVFSSLGANVLALGVHGKINDGCGSLHIENIRKSTDEFACDIGFAYDGDADRLLTVLGDGTLIDGDKALLMLALYFKKQGILKGSTVVGTLVTNMAIENALKSEGIELVRADVGDRYVIESMRECGSNLGAEQSGHIIISDFLPTGDGVLTSLVLSEIFKKDRPLFKYAAHLPLYPQINMSYIAVNKQKVLSNVNLRELEEKWIKELKGSGRVLVRASGTEPKIRIMVECENKQLAETISNEFFELMKVISD